MQSHLCPAMDPILVQPHITRPFLLHHQLLGSVLIRLPHCCLHSSPHVPALYGHCPPPTPHPAPLRKQLQVLKQACFFCPHQPFQLVPTPTRYPAVLALWGSFLTPVCLYTLVPLFRAREQCTGHRRKVEEGTCHSLLLLQGPPCPSSSHSPQWVHLTIYESPCHL